MVLCVDDPSGPVMETSQHTSLYVGQMMGLKVVISVCVHGYKIPVDRDIQAPILSSGVQHVEEWECPVLFMLHNELDGQQGPIKMAKELMIS